MATTSYAYVIYYFRTWRPNESMKQIILSFHI